MQMYHLSVTTSIQENDTARYGYGSRREW